MTSEIVDEFADFDQPYIRWSVVVTYPAGRGGVYAGTTVRLGRQEARHLAALRRDWHIGNGATTAVVEEQVWAPGPWMAVDGA